MVSLVSFMIDKTRPSVSWKNGTYGSDKKDKVLSKYMRTMPVMTTNIPTEKTSMT